jgi:hypothetical protein
MAKGFITMYDSLSSRKSSLISHAIPGIAEVLTKTTSDLIESGDPVNHSATGVTPSRGRLKNGNPGGDLSQAVRCGAKTRKGTPCQAPAMVNPKTGKRLRCRMHGGGSGGPTSDAGKTRCAQANYKLRIPTM